MGKYYIVDNAILPDVLEQVIEARTLLQTGEVQQISEAVKRVGISRGTYYKYKDYVFLPSNHMNGRKAVISFMLSHQAGMLSKVLELMSQSKANIITINQNIPIHDVASVVLSLDMNEMEISMDELLKRMQEVEGVSNIRLEAIE